MNPNADSAWPLTETTPTTSAGECPEQFETPSLFTVSVQRQECEFLLVVS